MSLVVWGEVFVSRSAVAKKWGEIHCNFFVCNSGVADAHALTMPNMNLPTWPRRFEVMTDMVMISI